MHALLLLPLTVALMYAPNPALTPLILIFSLVYTSNSDFSSQSLNEHSLWLGFLNSLSSKESNLSLFCIFLPTVLLVFFKTIYPLKWVLAPLWLTATYVLQVDLGIFIIPYMGTTASPRLSNGALLLHPLFLYAYYSAFLCFVYISMLYLLSNEACRRKWDSSEFVQPPMVSGFIALILGAWWSNQEFNWGGAWSWDVVEIYLLSTFLWSTLFIHARYKNAIKIYLYLSSIFTVLVYFIAVRANIGNSVHSFLPTTASGPYTWCFLILVSVSFFKFYQSANLFKISTRINYILCPYKAVLIGMVFCINLPIFLNYFYFLLTSGGSLDLGTVITALLLIILTATILPNTTSIQFFLPLVESLYFLIFIKFSKIANPLVGLHIIACAITIHFILYYNLVFLSDLHNILFITFSFARSSDSLVEQVLMKQTYQNNLAALSAPGHTYTDTSYYIINAPRSVAVPHIPSLVEYPSCSTHNQADTVIFPFYRFYKLFWISAVWVYLVFFFMYLQLLSKYLNNQDVSY